MIRNFDPSIPPPLFGVPPNQQGARVFPPASSIKLPKQYLEIYNWKLLYHGDEKDELPIERFLFRVQRMATENGLPKERLAANFGVLLKGVALNWYWEYLETYGAVTWEVLKEAMIERFKTRRTDDEVKQEMERRKQKFKESFLDFYHSVRSLSLSLLKPISDRELISLISRNMRGGLQANFAGRPFSNIAEMVRQCVSVEDTWNRLGWTPEIFHQVRPRQVSELDVIDENGYNGAFGSNYSEQLRHSDSVCAISTSKTASGTTYTSREREPNSNFQKLYSPNTCWNCYSIGHLYKDCARPFEHRFCFGCGAPNVLKPHCTQCKEQKQGNMMRDFRNPGTLNSRTPTNMQPRPLLEEAATNTDPELYRTILRRDPNQKRGE